MGNVNVTTTRRKTVSKELEKYCKPTGLYETCPWEERVVRRWILDGHVAPRFPGVDAPSFGEGGQGKGVGPEGLEAAATAAAAGISGGRGVAGAAGGGDKQQTEECPICFMHYQGVNRTVCCSKPLCTECYLQVRPPRSSVVCPFCNCAKFNVAYRGPPSKEESDKRMVEEQRTIEARIRAEQEELMRQAKERSARASSDSAAAAAQGEVAGSATATGGTSERRLSLGDSPSLSSSFGSSASSVPARASLATVAERRLTEERIRNQHQHMSLPTVSSPLGAATVGSGAGAAASSLEHALQRRRQHRGRNSRTPRRPSSGENEADSGDEFQDHGDGLRVEPGDIQQVEDLMLMEALRLSVLEEQARRERSGDLIRRQVAEAAAAMTGGGGSAESAQASQQQQQQQQSAVPSSTVPASLGVRVSPAYRDQSAMSPLRGQQDASSSARSDASTGTGIQGYPPWWDTAHPMSASGSSIIRGGTGPAAAAADAAASAADSTRPSFWRVTPGSTAAPSVGASAAAARATTTAVRRHSASAAEDLAFARAPAAGVGALPAAGGDGGEGKDGAEASIAAATAQYGVLMGIQPTSSGDGESGTTGGVGPGVERSAASAGAAASRGAEGAAAGGGGGGQGYPAELPESEEEQLLLAIELSLHSGSNSTESGNVVAGAVAGSGGDVAADDRDATAAAAAIAAVAASESSASPFSSFAEGAFNAYGFSAGASAAAAEADTATPAADTSSGRSATAGTPGKFNPSFLPTAEAASRRPRSCAQQDNSWILDTAGARKRAMGDFGSVAGAASSRVATGSTREAGGSGFRGARSLPPEELMGWVARERYRLGRDPSKSAVISKLPAPTIPEMTPPASSTTPAHNEGKAAPGEEDERKPSHVSHAATSLAAASASRDGSSSPAAVELNPTTRGGGDSGSVGSAIDGNSGSDPEDWLKSSGEDMSGKEPALIETGPTAISVARVVEIPDVSDPIPTGRAGGSALVGRNGDDFGSTGDVHQGSTRPPGGECNLSGRDGADVFSESAAASSKVLDPSLAERAQVFPDVSDGGSVEDARKPAAVEESAETSSSAAFGPNTQASTSDEVGDDVISPKRESSDNTRGVMAPASTPAEYTDSSERIAPESAMTSTGSAPVGAGETPVLTGGWVVSDAVRPSFDGRDSVASSRNAAPNGDAIASSLGEHDDVVNVGVVAGECGDSAGGVENRGGVGQGGSISAHVDVLAEEPESALRVDHDLVGGASGEEIVSAEQGAERGSTAAAVAVEGARTGEENKYMEV